MLIKDSLSNDEIVKSPLDGVYKDYKWNDEFIKPEHMRTKLENFFGGVGSRLGLTAESVQAKMDIPLGMAKRWYEQVFPNGEMTYHNVDHVRVTSAVAIKIFLGKLESLRYQNDGQGVFANKEAMEQLVATAGAAFALHEVDDWWGGGDSKIRIKNKPDFANMRTKLNVELAIHGIKASDVDKLVSLDDFVNDLPVMLARLEKAGFEGFLEMVGEDQRLEIAEAIGEALSAADYAQICNDSYSEQASVVDEKGVKHRTFRGTLALAREFELYRPNALKPSGWAREDDPESVDLEKIEWTRWFYDTKAYPRIMRSLQSLWLFDPGEAIRVSERMEELEGQFAD